jgi:dTDP-4-amino-4,6-dideoxygalactose transaminase
MSVPLLDLSKQHAELMPEIRAVFERVVSTGQFIFGPYLESFEKDLAKYCGAADAVGVTSGTDALLVAMMALGIGPGDEVITSPFTFFATAGSIARLGAIPVFVDIQEDTFNLDPRKIEAAITDDTKAIMPVHLFGQTADMATILAIASEHGLKVVEDCAQAIGAKEAGRMAGAIGDVGCLSFYPTKNLAALGDAGACVTTDPALAKRIRMLRNHGMEPKYYHPAIGGNFRLDALKAGALGVKLPHLPRWTEARRRNAQRYRERLADLPVILPVEQRGKEHVFNQFTIRVPNGRREELRTHLHSRKIGHDVYYPVPLHLQECFAYLGHIKGDFPEAERATAEVLSLPVYPDLSDEQLNEVVTALREFFR